jgi:hypothetical protein
VLGRPDIDAETLAAKHQFPVKKMVARHRAKILTPHGPRTCYEARIERDGKATGRPVRRDTGRGRLTIVFTALAVSRWIEHQTGWSIRKFVPTARSYRNIQIQTGEHTITAADPLADDLHQALDHIHGRTSAQIG